MIDVEGNICLEYNCSACCNPVKISSIKLVDVRREGFPFIELGEILIPEKNPDCVRLKSYRCTNFNVLMGLCDDYSKRPEICRNARCPAFKTEDKRERARIIRGIKEERFIRINTAIQEVSHV